MAEKTGSVVIEGVGEFEELVDGTQALPPMLVADKLVPVKGILKGIAVVPDPDKAGKFRNFYRIQLTEAVKGMDAKKVPVGYDAGDLISYPGSGGLDWQLASIAKKEQGLDEAEKNFKWIPLYGYYFVITRVEDEILGKRHRYAGKPVKAFNIQYAKPKGGAKK